MGYRIRMAPAVERWLEDMRNRDPKAAQLIDETVNALQVAGASLGSPLVVKVTEPGGHDPREDLDPREELDYSYRRQLEMLTKVRRAVADVATSRKRVELQVEQQEQQVGLLDDRRRETLDSDREDLSAEAASRQTAAEVRLGDLRSDLAQLQVEEAKLNKALQRLQAKVDAFRARKETIEGSYTAADAQLRISEAFAGVVDEFTDVRLPGDEVPPPSLFGAPLQLMELRPGAPDRIDIRILFAVQPPDTAVLVAAGGQRERLRAWYDQVIPRARARYWAGPESSA
jgi:hypothetical protein